MDIDEMGKEVVEEERWELELMWLLLLEMFIEVVLLEREEEELELWEW